MFTLTLKTNSTIPLDVSGLLPDKLATLSELEVARLPLLFGNRHEEMGQFFQVQRNSTSSSDLILRGDLGNVHNIGTKLTAGIIACEGPVGRHAGAQMTGGTLQIHGDAGNWLGAEMRGGEIVVNGSVGDGAGAAYRGSRRGMSGGSIRIGKHAGHELGLLMRRGLIVVDGDTGEFPGASLIAGTIVVRGKLGARAGAGMKRGTILGLGGMVELSAGMRFSSDYSPSFLAILGKHLNRELPGRVRCFRGDVLTGGRGELLLA